jgi:hypothetical protein
MVYIDRLTGPGGKVQHLKVLFLVIVLGLFAVTAKIAWAETKTKVMSDAVLETLSRGFKDLTQSKFDAAQLEYAKVIKEDFDNPYANNNLAVLMEKQGKLIDAMMYFNIGIKKADLYLNKVDTAYLFGGVCAAVNPLAETGEKSQIAQVMAENKKKLAEKMGSEPLEAPAPSGK